MKKVIEINKRKIGNKNKVFVIAEIGINHDGNFENAKTLVDKAKTSGADAVKLQTYITEKRVPKDSPIFGILKKCELSFAEQERLFEYACSRKIGVFSTPFDDESVEFLASIGAACYKVASFDIVNKKLLEKVASKGKPLIISRGMANTKEVENALAIAGKHKADVALLHCISAYPVPKDASLNLRTINALKTRYGCPVGFSDHTLGIKAAKYAVFAGADIIEKHFTLSKKNDGPDHALSVEPQELSEMIDRIRDAERIMGGEARSAVPAEKEILQYRRVS